MQNSVIRRVPFRTGLLLGLFLLSFGCGGSGGGGNPPPPAPTASLSPASLNFGNENVGITSAAQSVTLSNTGSAALSITSIAASGDFAETNNCGTSLAAGSNCTIQVTFTPTATGARTGALTVTDNASGSPQTVSLSGTGTTSGGGQASTFYVAPNGNDSWSGTLDAPNASNTDGPFATFDRARLAVQALDKTGLSQVVVQFRAGTYTLTAPEQFTAADSGTASTEITYENYPGESPVISGGVEITGWTPSTSVAGAWQASVAGLKPFEQLWVNGQRRYRVRVPVSDPSGYFYNLGPVYVTSSTGCTNLNDPSGYSKAQPVTSGAYAGDYECYDRFFFKTGDINPNWSGFSDSNNPIEVIDFEDWTIARMRLYKTEPSAGYLNPPANSSVADLVGTTAEGAFWGFLTGHRYLIDDVKDVLSSSTPGEWYLDEDASGNPAILTYVPATGEDFANNPPVVIAPQANQLVVSADPNGFSYVTFKGLTFSYANWVAGSPGAISTDAGQDVNQSQFVPAALSFNYASHVTLDSVIVSQVGGWGAEFVGNDPNFTAPSSPCKSQSAQNCSNQIVNSMFTDLGSGAVRLGSEPNAADTDANVAQYNLIYNTVLAGGDRMLPGAAIWLANSHNNVIDHNDIHDFYNMGINLGHSLNFNGNGFPNWTHDNQITYDLIHQLGQGVTSDMGCVHTATGLETGNIIEHNNCHNITHDPGTGGYGGQGIYLDQGSSFLTVEFNLVYNTSASGFTYNGSQQGTYQLNGTPNVIQNNIFALGAQDSIYRNGNDGALNMTFENNIVYWDELAPPHGQMLSPQYGVWSCANAFTSCFDFQQNMYYSTMDPNMTTWRFVTGALTQTPYTLAQWQAIGEDTTPTSTVNVDPLFVCPGPNPCGGSGPFNFNLQSGSQAPSLIGFQPFDPSQAGRANPVLMPTVLPPAFPLQLPPSY